MAATIFHLESIPDHNGGLVVLDGPEGHHAATVRRMRVGEELILTDGAGSTARGVVERAAKDVLEIRVTECGHAHKPVPHITIVQALPKLERSELAVELVTEAGADVIIPWSASRCVAKWEGLKLKKGVDKWRKTALAAAKQSRRTFFPVVADVHTSTMVAELVSEVTARGGVAIVLHEASMRRIADITFTDAPEVVLIIGPEGGVAPEELDRFVGAGALCALLGPTVLRTSTAGAVALGALGVLTRKWDTPPID
ncbi:16S rRNA (uracil(1498)-N(3))-methyltransferase [Hoyosella rhizosphaerae]|uniref:Ribosomal RNA small subunit methyltransferase E n=1 Tax=Hoyosella rhizosphaerae TaxID=1755582 RepID=A0A916XH92_9ACTN|nr:16S rRNA (uracil(1498)-N(3))-methyltransferase [Hoyosella rhizosphaerae]MBN4928040.1 16S rRNA (uracil(1498)-N(3))-methyltransferase [Hoyosella rhizosphaerae]GGC71922.1 ribosomal RNA small subunit methyltransferase E [Hoyosella rhizosphaerae]